MANHVHEGDLPPGLFAGAESVAIDSETMGLRLGRDPLCVVQISAGDGDAAWRWLATSPTGDLP